MQCPHNAREIHDMYHDLAQLDNGGIVDYINDSPDPLSIILGAFCGDIPMAQMLDIWEITGSTVQTIYRKIVNDRIGVG